MPTPFTHLEIAQRLLTDEQLSHGMRDFLHGERPAFLLGNIAADARVGNGAPREHTHFYQYGQNIEGRVWRAMIDDHPDLMHPHSPAHRAFVAGYVAHLTVDETWSLYMVYPHFVQREWADRARRFFMLHIILIYMDERDLSRLEAWQPDSLCAAEPHNWLAFIPDDDLRRWQSTIYDQIKPDGDVQTLDIFGSRIGTSPQAFRDILDSPVRIQTDLWDHISKDILHGVESICYERARQQMRLYLQESESA